MPKTLKDVIQKRHLHWDILAYEKLTETKQFEGVTRVSLIGYQTEREALQVAKNTVVRPKYYLEKVWECNTCGLQDEQMKFFRDQTKLIRKIVKDES